MLKNKNLILHAYLLVLGMIGIFSILFVPFNFEVLHPEVKDILLSKFSEFQLRISSLISPSFLLLISLLIGFLINKEKPHLSYFLSYITKSKKKDFIYYLKVGLIYGLILSLVITLLYLPIKDYDIIKVLETKSPNMPLITRVLYGGITEEIIVRWGWLSLILFISIKIFKRQRLSEIIAILLSALLFGLGHLPVVFYSMGDSINLFIIAYIVIFNMLAGTVFGYLFLKYNLETAIFSHFFYHIFIYIINLLHFL